MPKQREVFRIEEFTGMAAPPTAALPEADDAARYAEIMTELRALREMLADRGKPQWPPAAAEEPGALKSELDSIYDAVQRTKQEIATLVLTSFTTPEMGRVSQELNAVVGGTETATHRILQAGEEIEEAAKMLGAAI